MGDDTCLYAVDSSCNNDFGDSNAKFVSFSYVVSHTIVVQFLAIFLTTFWIVYRSKGKIIYVLP